MTLFAHLLRPELREFAAYQCASPQRGVVRLHANETWWRAGWDDTADGLNRYPDPRPAALIDALARLYGLDAERVLVTRGSDDGIDVLVRAFCRAGEDAVVVCPPTFGMYGVAARLQGAGVREVPLGRAFALDPKRVLEACTPGVVKLVFLCSPNNPTGNRLSTAAIVAVCRRLAERALVVVDEAYVEFCSGAPLTPLLQAHPNLVLLRTLSKAWGLAGARCGALLADAGLVATLRALLPPYPLPSLSVEAALKRLDPAEVVVAQRRIAATVRRRRALAARLERLPSVQHVWPSEANFLLAQFRDATATARACAAAGVLVRDFGAEPRLPNCLRITVGAAAENRRLLAALESPAVRARA